MKTAPENASGTAKGAAFLHGLRQAVEEALWPTRCAVCDGAGDVLCGDCRISLPFIDAISACPVCGAPHGAVQCTECNAVMLAASGRERFPFTGMASALVLDDSARRIALAYKDGAELRLAEVMGNLMAQYAHPAWLHEQPVVTFIPSTRAARARRGFDHGELTSRAVADALGLAHASLFAEARSHDQRALNRSQRASNMAAAIELKEGAALPRAVLVIDDVCTTGATLYSAADALERAGVEKRFALTFARTLT